MEMKLNDILFWAAWLMAVIGFIVGHYEPIGVSICFAGILVALALERTPL